MKFHLDDDQLTIELEGFESLWAFRRSLILPRANITRVAWHSDPTPLDLLLRTGGTSLPGVLLAGNFRGQGMKQFLYVWRPQGLWRRQASNVLIIDLRSFNYARVVISCKKEDAAPVLAWAGEPVG